MARKIFWVILIPALLVIMGYVGLQIYLRNGNKSNVTQPTGTGTSGRNAARTDNKKSGSAADGSTPAFDSLGGKKVSAMDLRPLFLQKLQQLIQKSTGSLYLLSAGDMKLDVFSSKLSLHAVTLRPDAQVLKRLQANGEHPAEVYTASFDSLLIEGINLDDALTSKTMDYRLVKLVNPVIRIDRYQQKNQKSKMNVEEGFLKEMEKLAINRLVVEEGSITVNNKAQGTTKKFNRVTAQLKNILLNESTRGARDRFLFAKEATMEMHDFSTLARNGLYRFKIKDAFINATERQVVLKNFQFAPTLSKQAFMKKQSRATELYNLSIPSVTIQGVNWWEALNGDAISARLIQTRGGRFSVYFDRSLPPKNKMGNFPNQLLRKAPFLLDINKLQIRNLAIAYEEFNPLSEQSGTIYLDKTNLTVSNLRNGKGSREPVVVNGNALLMHSVPLNATFRFNMAEAEKGKFTATIRTSGFQGKVMNPVARPLGMLNIDRGEVQQLDATIQGHEWGATGDVRLRYDDLKLSLLEKNKTGKGMNDKNLLSLLANVLVIRNSNPKQPEEKAEKKQASFQRDPQNGFVNLVWKTAFVGILKTIGAPEKMAKKK
jgi:hypothetical protein